MKKFQRLLVSGIVASVAAFSTFANAEVVTMKTHPSLYEGSTSCDGGTFNQVMYAGSDHHEMIDTFTEENTSYVWQFLPSSTWVSTYNVIPNAINMPILDYFSNGKPHNVTTVVVVGSKDGASITTNIPASYDRSDIAAQVVYHIARSRWVYKQGTANTLKYLDYNNLGAGTQTYQYGVNISAGSLLREDNECLNIHIGFCGDGILDNSSNHYSKNIYAPLDGGEICDPNDPNETNWGTDGCSATCQPINKEIVQPKCGSTYNNKDLYNTKYPIALLNADTPGLCDPGEASPFVGPSEPNREYQWECKGEQGSTPAVGCNARELWCGDGKLQSDHEECDPNQPVSEQASWNGMICNSSCKLENKPVDKIYDIALTKTFAGGYADKTYKPGDKVVFRITIYNQGDYMARNIEITEYIPNGLTLEDGKWTQNGNKATRVVTDDILPGMSTSITITMRIDASFKGKSIVNKAEISKDNSGEYGTHDIDSDPDTNPNNDCIVEYEHIITGNGKGYTEEGKACDETTDEDDHDAIPLFIEDSEEPGIPTIDKKLLEDKEYEVGDEVGFKITFKNTTDKVVKNAIIRDYLPLNLKYKSSEIFGVSPIKSGLYERYDGVQTLEYSGFDLSAHQEGYLIVTGVVLGSNLDHRINNVCIFGNDNPDSYECSNDKYTLGDRDIKIEKTVDKTNVASGDVVEYTITITNLKGVYTGYVITDTLPKGLILKRDAYQGQPSEYKVYYDGNVSLDPFSIENVLDENGNTVEKLTWNISFSDNGFTKGKTFVLKFKAIVTETLQKKYTNLACLIIDGTDSCDPADVITDIKLGIKKYVSSSFAGTYYDDKTTISNGSKAYFKLVIGGAADPVKKFRVKDTLTDSTLLFLDESYSLPDNAFTGVIIFGSKNTGNHEYSIYPVVQKEGGKTKLQWNVEMEGDSVFMEGDTLIIYFVTEKKSDETNTAYACYDKDGVEECDNDPAQVVSPGGPDNPEKLKIKKYVGTGDNVNGAWYDDTLNLGTGDKAYFKLVVSGTDYPLTTFKVKDTLDDTKLLFLEDESKAISGGYYTGVIAPSTDDIAYTIVPTVIKDKEHNKTTLEWLVTYTKGTFKKGDTLTIIFVTEKKADEKNVGYACYDTDFIKCVEDPASVTSAVKLNIDKKVGPSANGAWVESLNIANGSIVYFQLTVTNLKDPVQKFYVRDDLDDAALLFLEKESIALSNNLFTGVVVFGTDNTGSHAYTIKPSISVTTSSVTKNGGSHQLRWDVDMGTGYFMKGDILTFVFAVKKNANVTNTAYVCLPDVKYPDACEKDPASVTYSTGGGGGPSGGGGRPSNSCGDGKKGGVEQCDFKREVTVIGSGLWLDSVHSVTGDYEGYTCTKSCTLQRKEERPKCFNVANGSISIMAGEMLPFYWNIEGKLGSKTPSERAQYLKDNFVVECVDGAYDKVELNSMLCHFTVLGPGKTKVYEFVADCLNSNGWSNSGIKNYYPIIKDFVEQNQEGFFGGSKLIEKSKVESMVNVFESLDEGWKEYPTLFPYSSKLLITDFGTQNAKIKGSKSGFIYKKGNVDTFGEYKISLDKVVYNVCTGVGSGKNQEVMNERVCEVDFAVTNHYLTQKSAYGTNNESSSTQLSAYKYMNGNPLFTVDVQKINGSTYAITKDLESTYKSFVKKYFKQAVNTKDHGGIKKVKGKSIYFVDTSVYGSSINIGGDHSFIKSVDRPFTLVVDDGNAQVIINKNLESNVMILTKGKIIFNAEGSCNGNTSDGVISTRYGHAGQMVRGIFYAEKGFDSINEKKTVNNDTSHSEWCNYGNLHIRGIALGDMDNVLNKRRSELYTWFHYDSVKTTEDKRNVVINGASVMIEANPDLWGDLPPGAEEFNTALSIYRK